MDINKYIGEKIRLFRQSKNITQEELAQYLKVSIQSVSRYELGDRKTDNDILFKLADYFNVSINDFFPPLNSFTEDIAADYMSDKEINATQLAILCKLNPNEVKRIISGEEKLPRPSSLLKIANAFGANPFDFLVASGYIEDPEGGGEDIFKSGIRYLLNDEDRKDLCIFLRDYWNKKYDNHVYTYDEIYDNLFFEDKKRFSDEEVRNIIVHDNYMKDINYSVDNNELNILNQYKILFDKDNKLTENQKEFILNTIEEQHRKIDEEIEKGNVN